MKIIAATSENTPVSTPVSTPTTAVVPSPVSSPISGALTGYGFFATYLDDSCTTFASATILPLNICFTDTDGTYTKLSFTSTTYRSEKYSDDACSMLSVAGTPKGYTSACISRSKIYVQPLMNIPTTSAYVTYG